MKLKLDFTSKLPKLARDNQVILLKDKKTKIKIDKFSNNSLFSNKLFLERKFLSYNIKDKNCIFGWVIDLVEKFDKS